MRAIDCNSSLDQIQNHSARDGGARNCLEWTEGEGVMGHDELHLAINRFFHGLWSDRQACHDLLDDTLHIADQ